MQGYRSIVMLLCLGVASCASNYQLSGETERLRSSLDQSQAEALLSKALPKTADAQGLCSSNIRLDRSRPEFVALNNGVVTFEEYDKKNFEAAAASVVMRRDRFQFQLTHLTQVRVLAPNAVAEVCKKSPTNKPLGLKDAEGILINVDVTAAEFDKFLAALLVLSPEARIAGGAGL